MDIVLFGGTGFTGGLTAEYLAKHAPADATWALAGRNMDKLEALRDRLGVDVPLLKADVEDPESLAAIAEPARVVITTVGPYVNYGEPLVKACAEHGTDYVDLTGEPEFVDRMYCSYNATAAASGARIVHACGFDSIPHDLGAQFTVEQLPEGVPLDLRGYVRAGGTPSGGTFASALTGFSRVRENIEAKRDRRKLEPRASGRKASGAKQAPHYDRDIGAWVLPMPTIDPQIILRSARAIDRYGPEFRYGHYIAVKNPAVAAGIVGGVGALIAAAQIPPARKWLMNRKPAGSGPDKEKREKSWFNIRFVGEGGGERVVTEVAGGDPGYSETSKMLAESAMCLAFDENLPPTAGQVTTAQAMGHALRDRLQNAGITFKVVES
jgi:short subunit dehydrogenase-like uncharacterized protein